ncbi:UvrABC system protein C [Parasponia andersonii]|uniref:UvrABC system protein C n=1 Tax=Parasponia andersonii TaxID=3476 RepID=A0A2P5ACF6_PARAD|nr:UvrABC system protein C [Parasponia andersonii]
MGNCSPKGTISGDNSPKSSFIRVLTDSGSILEFKGPKLASEVLSSHPGYGIFRQGHGSSPVADDERLLGGKFYYLLPLGSGEQHTLCGNTRKMGAEYVAAGTCKKSLSHSASAEFVEDLANGSAMEVLPSGGDGVWRVKLMIDTKQLEEILSEQGNTEALIERMRMVASCAGTLKQRHNKSSWKSNLSGLFKVPADHNRRESPVGGYLHC